MARSRSRRSRGAPECCHEPPAPRYPALHFAWSHTAPSAAARLYERDDRLDLDGNPGRQARRPDRAARRQPGLAEHLRHQVRKPVDDGRMIGVFGRRVDEAEHLDDPRNAIERAEVCAQRREHREPVQPRRLTPGRHVERRAELAHAPAAVGAHRPVAGGVEQLPVLEDGRIRGDGLGRRRQDDAERCEAALVRHDRIVWPDIFPRAMTDEAADQAHSRILSTTVGDLPREEVKLEIDGRTWNILHTGAIITHADEERFLRGEDVKLPYGIVLWPAAIALAHELATRDVNGLRVLELGAGTGLPGLVAAARGARVVKTDRRQLVQNLSRMNE